MWWRLWTATEGVEITYKGRKALPAKDQEEYFRRAALFAGCHRETWLKDPSTLLIYGGTAVVARREVEEVTLVDKDNNSLEVDVERSTHLPLRRIFKFRNAQYKDFDEDLEEYSDFSRCGWHSRALRDHALLQRRHGRAALCGRDALQAGRSGAVRTRRAAGQDTRNSESRVRSGPKPAAET